MRSTTYAFEPKIGLLNNKIFYLRDYFQYYTTGVEEIILDNASAYRMTTREEGERPEQIMFDILGDENMGDLFCALNNQNYLWISPFSLDGFQDAIQFRMNYIELLMRDRIQRIDVTDEYGQKIVDESGDYIWEYNEVGKECLKTAEEDITNIDTKSRLVIIPNPNDIQLVNRKIDEYFKSRVVK